MTQPPTDELRLVPCPFCGGDVINTRSQEMTKGPAYYWHKCETCGAESEGDYGEDVAVAAWNRRAAPASPLPGGGYFVPAITFDHIAAILRSKGLGEYATTMSRNSIALPAAPTGEPE